MGFVGEQRKCMGVYFLALQNASGIYIILRF